MALSDLVVVGEPSDEERPPLSSTEDDQFGAEQEPRSPVQVARSVEAAASTKAGAERSVRLLPWLAGARQGRAQSDASAATEETASGRSAAPAADSESDNDNDEQQQPPAKKPRRPSPAARQRAKHSPPPSSSSSSDERPPNSRRRTSRRPRPRRQAHDDQQAERRRADDEQQPAADQAEAQARRLVLQRKTVAQLRETLRCLHQPASGHKAELIERLALSRVFEEEVREHMRSAPSAPLQSSSSLQSSAPPLQQTSSLQSGKSGSLLQSGAPAKPSSNERSSADVTSSGSSWSSSSSCESKLTRSQEIELQATSEIFKMFESSQSDDEPVGTIRKRATTQTAALLQASLSSAVTISRRKKRRTPVAAFQPATFTDTDDDNDGGALAVEGTLLDEDTVQTTLAADATLVDDVNTVQATVAVDATLVDDATTLAVDATLVDRSTPLAAEPTLIDDASTLVDRSTPLAAEPTLIDDASAPVDQSTPLATDATLIDDASTLIDQSTPLATDATLIDEATPLTVDATLIDDASTLRDEDAAQCRSDDDQSDGSQAGLLVSLSQGGATPLRAGSVLQIGRSTSSDIRIENARVSKKHCQLHVASDGELRVCDMSRNGTYLNGSRLYDAEPQLVADGDRLSFSEHVSFLVIKADPTTTTD